MGRGIGRRHRRPAGAPDRRGGARAAGGGQLRRVLGRRRGAGRPARRTAHRRRQRLRRVRAVDRRRSVAGAGDLGPGPRAAGGRPDPARVGRAARSGQLARRRRPARHQRRRTRRADRARAAHDPQCGLARDAAAHRLDRRLPRRRRVPPVPARRAGARGRGAQPPRRAGRHPGPGPLAADGADRAGNRAGGLRAAARGALVAATPARPRQRPHRASAPRPPPRCSPR